MDSRQIFVLIVMASAVVVFLGAIMFNVFNIHWEVKDSRKRLFDYLDANMKARKHLDQILRDIEKAQNLPKKYIMDSFYELLKNGDIEVGWYSYENSFKGGSNLEIYIKDKETGESRCIHKAQYNIGKSQWEEIKLK